MTYEKAMSARRSSTQAKPRASLTAHDRFDTALDMLAAVSNAPGQSIHMDDLARELSITEAKLEEIVTLVQTLADRSTGARIILTCEDGVLKLVGNGGAIAPVRLNPDESMAVYHVLARHRIAVDVRARIERALMAPQPNSDDDSSHMSADPLFGGFYQFITEALQDGAPLVLTYRSRGDHTSRPRVVDPGYIELADDAAYLVAWDNAVDDQRRYRLDRIADARIAEGSVTHHPFRRDSIHDSLQRTGRRATLRFASRDAAEQLGWAGIDFEHGCEGEGGVFTADVYYADEHWLLDHTLAAGGDITILEPATLVDALRSRAQELLASVE